MNSKISLVGCLLIFFFQASSQVKPSVNVTDVIRNNSGMQKITASQWIQIYAEENYQGMSKIYTGNGATPDFQKKLFRVSCKLSPKTVAYLTVNCTDFTYEIMLTESSPSVVIPDMGGICGVRLDEVAYVCVKFNGIETQVHNNDCKKITGKIVVQVMERQPNSNFLYCYNRGGKRESVFMNVPKGSIPDFSTYVYNTVQEPLSEPIRIGTARPVRYVQDSFIVGKSALTQRKIYIKISGNVNSEHKLNDLSSDYTDNVAAVFSNEFQVNRLPFFNIQSKGKVLTAGPYRATGSNPNGPGYIIVKQIKLYFSVLYDFYLTGE